MQFHHRLCVPVHQIFSGGVDRSANDANCAAYAIADCCHCHTPFVAFAKETVHGSSTIACAGSVTRTRPTTSNWAAWEGQCHSGPTGGANGEASDDDCALAVWALHAAENCCCFFLPVACSWCVYVFWERRLERHQISLTNLLIQI
jgi:hypothetical protein